MKDRIVIWGQDEKDTDVLIAIRLLQNSDIIKIWTFPIKGIDDAFVDGLFKDWKDGDEEKFPQPHTLVERGISEENMLPEGLKTPKTDVIKIAEQEWRVRVLSYRLYEHIKQQIEQLKVRVGNLTIYSKDVWEEAKDVSRSIKENTLDRNIKREQTTELRKGIDEVFDQMKKLQNVEQAKYLETSKNNMVAIRTKVTEVLEKVGTERNTKTLWNKLLAYQQEVKGMQMSPRDRNALRLNFNEAFNALKADIKSNVGNRLNARVNGLKSAIGKMEASIKRDKDNVAYQSERINKNSTSQLEYQLRSAKLKLIEDRIQSKEQKLHDMYLTLKDLEKKAEKIPKPKKVEIKAKQKVAASTGGVVVNDNKNEGSKDVASKEEVSSNDAIASTTDEVKTDVSKTVTEEVQEKTNAVVENKIEEVKSQPVAEQVAKANENIADAVQEKTEEANAVVENKIEEVKSQPVAEQAAIANENVADAVQEKTEEANVADATQEKTEEANAVVENKIEEAKSQPVAAIANENVADVVQEVKSESVAEQAVKVNETVADTVEENVEQLKEVTEKKTEE